VPLVEDDAGWWLQQQVGGSSWINDDPTLGTRRSPDRCHQHTPKNCAHLSSVARGRYHRHCPQWQCFVGGVRAIGAGGAGAHWPTICPRTFSWELSWLADDRDDLSGKTGKQKRKKIKLLHSAEALSSHTRRQQIASAGPSGTQERNSAKGTWTPRGAFHLRQVTSTISFLSVIGDNVEPWGLPSKRYRSAVYSLGSTLVRWNILPLNVDQRLPVVHSRFPPAASAPSFGPLVPGNRTEESTAILRKRSWTHTLNILQLPVQVLNFNPRWGWRKHDFADNTALLLSNAVEA